MADQMEPLNFFLKEFQLRDSTPSSNTKSTTLLEWLKTTFIGSP